MGFTPSEQASLVTRYERSFYKPAANQADGYFNTKPAPPAPPPTPRDINLSGVSAQRRFDSGFNTPRSLQDNSGFRESNTIRSIRGGLREAPSAPSPVSAPPISPPNPVGATAGNALGRALGAGFSAYQVYEAAKELAKNTPTGTGLFQPSFPLYPTNPFNAFNPNNPLSPIAPRAIPLPGLPAVNPFDRGSDNPLNPANYGPGKSNPNPLNPFNYLPRFKLPKDPLDPFNFNLKRPNTNIPEHFDPQLPQPDPTRPFEGGYGATRYDVQINYESHAGGANCELRQQGQTGAGVWGPIGGVRLADPTQVNCVDPQTGEVRGTAPAFRKIEILCHGSYFSGARQSEPSWLLSGSGGYASMGGVNVRRVDGAPDTDPPPPGSQAPQIPSPSLPQNYTPPQIPPSSPDYEVRIANPPLPSIAPPEPAPKKPAPKLPPFPFLPFEELPQTPHKEAPSPNREPSVPPLPSPIFPNPAQPAPTPLSPPQPSNPLKNPPEFQPGLKQKTGTSNPSSQYSDPSFPGPYTVTKTDISKQPGKETTQTEEEKPFIPPFIFRPAGSDGKLDPGKQQDFEQQKLGPTPDATPKPKCQNGCLADLQSGQEDANNKLNQLDAVLRGLDLSLLGTINNKLGDQLTGGLSGKLTRFSKWMQFDRIMNIFILLGVLHNAAMLSKSAAETLGELTSQALAVIGIKGDDDQSIDVNEIIDKQANAFMASILGESVWNGTKESWQKANRIISTASNIISTIRSISDSTRDVMEWTAENTGKIGNALKRWRVVGENAYKWMPEKVTAQGKWHRKVDKVVEGIESIENTASSLASVVGDIRSIQSDVDDVKEQKQNFDKAIKEATPKDRPENDTTKARATAEKVASASPQLAVTDRVKGDVP